MFLGLPNHFVAWMVSALASGLFGFWLFQLLSGMRAA